MARSDGISLSIGQFVAQRAERIRFDHFRVRETRRDERERRVSSRSQSFSGHFRQSGGKSHANYSSNLFELFERRRSESSLHRRHGFGRLSETQLGQQSTAERLSRLFTFSHRGQTTRKKGRRSKNFSFPSDGDAQHDEHRRRHRAESVGRHR